MKKSLNRLIQENEIKCEHNLEERVKNSRLGLFSVELLKRRDLIRFYL